MTQTHYGGGARVKECVGLVSQCPEAYSSTVTQSIFFSLLGSAAMNAGESAPQ